MLADVAQKTRDILFEAYCILSRKEFVDSRYGIRMRSNWRDKTFRLCVFARYESFLSDYLREAESDFVFVDIGANQGLYAIIAAQNDKCRLSIAVEPVHQTFELLEKNIHANGLAEKVVALKVGISEEHRRTEINIKPGHSGRASLHNYRDGDSSQSIDLIKFDGLRDYVRNDAPIFIKIDTEGHEEAVVRSICESGLAPRVETVFYEVDERWLNPAPMEAQLRTIGMTRFEKVGGGYHYDVLATRR